MSNKLKAVFSRISNLINLTSVPRIDWLLFFIKRNRALPIKRAFFAIFITKLLRFFSDNLGKLIVKSPEVIWRESTTFYSLNKIRLENTSFHITWVWICRLPKEATTLNSFDWILIRKQRLKIQSNTKSNENHIKSLKTYSHTLHIEYKPKCY